MSAMNGPQHPGADAVGERNVAEQRGLTEWLPRWLASVQPSIAVIGDVMLDGWWSGSIERLCREAPAPVVEIQQRRFAPGGAANTAMNLAALGAKVGLAGIAGRDEAADELRRALRRDPENEIARRLRQAAPYADPCPLLVAYADEIMGRDGRMIDAIDDLPPPCPEISAPTLTLHIAA